jgi:hypothetical protein
VQRAGGEPSDGEGVADSLLRELSAISTLQFPPYLDAAFQVALRFCSVDCALLY